MSDRAKVRQDPVGVFIDNYLTVTRANADRITLTDMFETFERFAEGNNISSYTYEGFCKSLWAKDTDGISKIGTTVTAP